MIKSPLQQTKVHIVHKTIKKSQMTTDYVKRHGLKPTMRAFSVNDTMINGASEQEANTIHIGLPAPFPYAISSATLPSPAHISLIILIPTLGSGLLDAESNIVPKPCRPHQHVRRQLLSSVSRSRVAQPPRPILFPLCGPSTRGRMGRDGLAVVVQPDGAAEVLPSIAAPREVLQNVRPPTLKRTCQLLRSSLSLLAESLPC